MPLMSGGDAVVRSLVAHGISTIYYLPGVQSDHLFNAMFDAGDALRRAHGEQGLLALVRPGDRPAAYSVVPGPGFLNSSAALATAYSTGARVLALIGQIPSHGIGKGHGLLHEIPDQIGILRKLTKWAERVGTPQARRASSPARSRSCARAPRQGDRSPARHAGRPRRGRAAAVASSMARYRSTRMRSRRPPISWPRPDAR